MRKILKYMSLLLAVVVLAAAIVPTAFAATVFPGDVDGNDAVENKDITALRQHLAGGYSVSVNEKNADANKDGSVNVKDLVLLRRYIVGGYDETLPGKYATGTSGENATPWVPIH